MTTSEVDLEFDCFVGISKHNFRFMHAFYIIACILHN